MLGVLANNPDKAPEILKAFFIRLEKAEPNQGHVGLAELEKMGLLKSVMTQNVDGLHRLAGSSNVYELHGSMYRLRCSTCGQRTQLDKTTLFKLGRDLTQMLAKGSLAEVGPVFPQCKCGGRTRFDFVAFGEGVQDLEKAVKDAETCNWMLIVGTSGVVHPAASLPGYAKRNGAFLIEINPRESELTSACDLFLQGSAADTIPKLISELKKVPGLE
jgi:NAD-dependent deacetylase